MSEQKEYSYVWLNLNNGAFSNSWPQDTHDKHFDKDHVPAAGWKLIKYECLNDDKFVFDNHMKLR